MNTSQADQTEQPTITAIVLAKNEEEMLANCLDTLAWTDHIVVINNGSTDHTADIAQNHGAQVIHFEHSSFARLRNEALKHVDSDWLFYIDPDERVTPTLAKEIMVQMETSQAPAFTLRRKNIHYGVEFKHGGWDQDQVTRIFRRSQFQTWQGKIHESPAYQGQSVLLHTPLIHLTHRNTANGLKKSSQWTKMEAELLVEAGAAPVNFLTLVRKGGMEFLRRAIFKQGYKDGFPGVVEAVIQAINKILVYIQVWELQQTPSLPEQYRQHELKIVRQWRDTDL
jgi:(heptosyl)LPS beta-1,4-glucosyltransferase